MKIKFRKLISLIRIPKRIKYPQINLTIEVENMHTENYKTMAKRKLNRGQIERDTIFKGRKADHFKNVHITQRSLQI